MHLELALFGSHLGDVEAEVADRNGLERLSRLAAIDAWQAADVMTLEQAVQTGTIQTQGGCLEHLRVIIQGQQCMLAERDDQRVIAL